MPRQPFFDARFHIVDPRFPLFKNVGFLPGEFTVEQYRARTQGLGLVGGAVVSGSFQRFDQGFLLDARDLPAVAVTLAALPAVSIDHLGLHPEGLPHLLALVERGVKVKATGFGRVELDVRETVRAVLDADPTALMAGSDLPSTRARRPFADADPDLLGEAAGPHGGAVFHDHAVAFYRV